MIFYAPLSFAIFLIAAFAKQSACRSNMPEAEQELMAATDTEYSPCDSRCSPGRIPQHECAVNRPLR